MKLSSDSFMSLCHGGEDIKIKSLLVYGSTELSVNLKINDLMRHSTQLKDCVVRRYTQESILTDPHGFLDRLTTSDLFFSKMLFIVTQATDKIVPILQDILKKGTNFFFVVKAAEHLKPQSKLRMIYEKDQDLGSLPCYETTTSDLLNAISLFLKSHPKKLNEESLHVLVSVLKDKPDLFEGLLETVSIALEKGICVDPVFIEALSCQETPLDISDVIDGFLKKNHQKTLQSLSGIDQSLSHIIILRSLMRACVKTYYIKNRVSLLSLFFKEKPSLEAASRLWSQHDLMYTLKKAVQIEAEMKSNSMISEEFFRFFFISNKLGTDT